MFSTSRFLIATPFLEAYNSISSSKRMSAENQFTPSEVIITEPQNEVMYVTTEFLIQENQSDKASERINAWNTNRQDGQLIAQKRCGDARTSLTKATRSVDIRYIACGGPNEPFGNLLNSSGVLMAGNFTHYDGEEMDRYISNPTQDRMPITCGGQKAALDGVKGHEGIGCYIEHDVEHFDPTIQAVVTAAEAAKTTDKIVFAASQDHLTGKATPLAVFADHGRKSASAIPQAEIYEMLFRPDSYNSRRIYQNGFPTLLPHEMPDQLAEFFASNSSQINEMSQRFPDLSERLKVQDPGLVVLSTDIRPVVVRYPGLEAPGSFFELRVPRTKVNGTDVQIDVAELERVLYQAEYPITHATHNADQQGQPFASTKQLLIETRDMTKSQHLAEVISKKPWMQKWLQLGDTEILTAQTVGGKLQEIEQYKI
jgi:hypothetical protein